MPDHVVRALLDPPRVRVVCALTTDTVREAARRHTLSGVAAVVLGRALTAGPLLATLTKGDERVTLQIAGDGPIRLVTVDADDAGDVRGYLSPPGVSVKLPDQPRLRVAPAVGRGTVSVLRDLGLREHFRGQVALVTGEIDEDVEAYLRQSEQLDSALGCEVLLGRDGGIARAAGILVQAMPGGEPALIRALQHALRTAALHDLLAGAAPPRDGVEIARALLGDIPFRVLDRGAVRFRCRCSRTRVRDMVALLGVAEIDDMLARDGQAEITCNFCAERYLLDRAELAGIRDEVARRPPERN